MKLRHTSSLPTSPQDYFLLHQGMQPVAVSQPFTKLSQQNLSIGVNKEAIRYSTGSKLEGKDKGWPDGENIGGRKSTRPALSSFSIAPSHHKLRENGNLNGTDFMCLRIA